MARQAPRLGQCWTALADEWRIKQLEYSWVGSLTGHGTRRDFAGCTADALDYVLARHGIANPGLRDELLSAYERLDPYPEVPGMLAALRGRSLRVAILSNGTPAMLSAACVAAGIASLIDAITASNRQGSSSQLRPSMHWSRPNLVSRPSAARRRWRTASQSCGSIVGAIPMNTPCSSASWRSCRTSQRFQSCSADGQGSAATQGLSR